MCSALGNIMSTVWEKSRVHQRDIMINVGGGEAIEQVNLYENPGVLIMSSTLIMVSPSVPPVYSGIPGVFVISLGILNTIQCTAHPLCTAQRLCGVRQYAHISDTLTLIKKANCYLNVKLEKILQLTVYFNQRY